MTPDDPISDLAGPGTGEEPTSPPRPPRPARRRPARAKRRPLARWLGWSPTVVRILYVALSILSAAFPGILVYLLLWLVMPREETAATGEPWASDLR